jgi:glycosyltransferase involved in cell wall biosynthesis
VKDQMKLLFISIAWPLPGERNLYSDLMDEFVLHGHQVHVIGTWTQGKGEGPDLNMENGISVLRIRSGQIRKTSYFRKTSKLLTLGGKIWSAVKEHLADEQYDLILGPTPPITLSNLYRKLKKHYNAPFYLLLKDIWPQGSVDLKVIRKYSLPWLFLRRHEKRLYRTADHIGTMSPMGAEYILSKNRSLPASKVEVCPNSIKPSEMLPVNGGQEIRDKYGIPGDACVLIFSGNLGIGHGLHFLVEAIQALSDYPKAYFVIGGSGTQFNYLEKKVKELLLENVFLYNWLPREDFERILATSDVGLILLYRYTSPQFPSRLLSYYDYAKPALCAVNKDTDIGTIVEKEGCGRSVNHGDLNSFIEAVKFFCEQVEKRKIMGENGRKLLMDRYTVSHSYKIIMNHFR